MNASLTKSLRGLLVAAVLIMGPGALKASAGIAAAPLKQEINLKPGEEGKVTLLLSYVSRTQGDAGQGVRIALQDVQALEDGSLVFKDAGTLPTSASKWISLAQSDVMLEPGQSKALECTIKVPLSAAPGEYYTAAMVTLAQKGVNDKGVAVQYRIASGIFVTVLGRTFPKEAKIAECKIVWPESAASRPAAGETAEASKEPQMPFVRLVLKNAGQARFDAKGKITLYDERSRWVLTAPFDSKRPMVFAGDTRLFTAPINKALAPGKYTLRVEMDYESAWAKARQELPLDILPAQADLLATIKRNGRDRAVLIESGTPSLAATLSAGASRTLAIALKDIGEAQVSCRALATATTAGAETWLNITPDSFTIAKGSKKSLIVYVDVPAGAAPGKYSSTVTVDATIEGATSSQISIPVEIEVKAGR